ncbi:mitochondrial import receptor subunit Tom22 [Ophidiomyces ophidiicola]|nr:mitochondrial import receptor subunit Tom22 [Ophidiomyces ophidiicola]
MVKLTEVEDEHFKEKPTTSNDDALLVSDEEDDDFTDTESEISSDSYSILEEETLLERLAALQDIISPSSRRKISNVFSSVTSFTKSTFSFGGKTLWVVSTSAFLLGVPWALALAEEQQYVQMEREQGMIKGANEMLTPGATSALTQQPAQPTL